MMKFSRPSTGTHLYKYYPPQTAALVLSNRRVRFSPINEFNDPFELNTYPIHKITPFDFGYALANNILEVIRAGEELKGSGPLIDLIECFRKGLIKDISAYDFAMNLGVAMAKKQFVFEPSLQDRVVRLRLARFFGALCLSENFDSLLMWAHYAKNHEGIVLGIDPNEVGGVFDLMAPVVYRDSYPTRDDPYSMAATYLGRTSRTATTAESTLVELFFSKSKEWSYEREWRAILNSNIDLFAETSDYSAFLGELPPAAFVSIYVGCRCQREMADELIKKARAFNPSIQVYKCRTSTNDYALETQPYDEPWPNLYPPESDVI